MLPKCEHKPTRASLFPWNLCIAFAAHLTYKARGKFQNVNSPILEMLPSHVKSARQAFVKRQTSLLRPQRIC